MSNEACPVATKIKYEDEFGRGRWGCGQGSIHQAILIDKYIVCSSLSLVLRFLPDPYA